MIPILDLRREGWRLGRTLRRSLLYDSQGWIERGTTGKGAELYCAEHHMSIVLIPCCCLRLLDKIRVYHRDADVWLPLISRLRLRIAARLFLAERANECWECPEG